MSQSQSEEFEKSEEEPTAILIQTCNFGGLSCLMTCAADLRSGFSKVSCIPNSMGKKFLLGGDDLEITLEVKDDGSSLLLGFVYQKPVVHKKITSHPICV